MVEFELINFKEDQKKLGQLLDTIIIPTSMSKLNEKLPSKKKRARALSCSKLKIIRKNSVTDLLID